MAGLGDGGVVLRVIEKEKLLLILLFGLEVETLDVMREVVTGIWLSLLGLDDYFLQFLGFFCLFEGYLFSQLFQVFDLGL